jgi:hypothetical protein
MALAQQGLDVAADLPPLNPADTADRATFALNKLPGGKTRM